MMDIHQKEQAVDTALLLLKQLREDLRKSSRKCRLEINIPIICNSLMSIVYTDTMDSKLIDIFEGYKNWKDKDLLDFSINSILYDDVNYIRANPEFRES